jgi:hypothetical protein
LTQFEKSPETIFRECRARIDQDAAPNEHENLLSVTQLLAGLRYNDFRLFDLLGGRKAMIDSPLLQEFIADARREAVVTVLTSRFGITAGDVEADLKTIEDAERLNELLRLAASCRSLKSFRKQLSP